MLAVVSHNPKVWKPNFTDRGGKCLGYERSGASEALEMQKGQIRGKKDNRISMAKVDIIIEF